MEAIAIRLEAIATSNKKLLHSYIPSQGQVCAAMCRVLHPVPPVLHSCEWLRRLAGGKVTAALLVGLCAVPWAQRGEGRRLEPKNVGLRLDQERYPVT